MNLISKENTECSACFGWCSSIIQFAQAHRREPCFCLWHSTLSIQTHSWISGWWLWSKKWLLCGTMWLNDGDQFQIWNCMKNLWNLNCVRDGFGLIVAQRLPSPQLPSHKVFRSIRASSIFPYIAFVVWSESLEPDTIHVLSRSTPRKTVLCTRHCGVAIEAARWYNFGTVNIAW